MNQLEKHQLEFVLRALGKAIAAAPDGEIRLTEADVEHAKQWISMTTCKHSGDVVFKTHSTAEEAEAFARANAIRREDEIAEAGR